MKRKEKRLGAEALRSSAMGLIYLAHPYNIFLRINARVAFAAISSYLPQTKRKVLAMSTRPCTRSRSTAPPSHSLM